MKTYTHDAYAKKMKRATKGIPRYVETALISGGEVIVGTAIKEHLSGPKMAKGAGDKSSRATLQPQSGRLKNSIHSLVRRIAKAVKLFVGTNLIYAASHEFGDPPRGIPERSFLRSSRDAKIDKVKDLIAKKMVEGIEDA